MKKEVEGMKQKPSGGVNKATYNKNVIPTNISLVSKLSSMLNAIKHQGKPVPGNKMPFGK